ncbi:HORMA domain-containing protein [Trametes meyenii]|nr:HORMA domain-containing protein [Trametes meyenii]
MTMQAQTIRVDQSQAVITSQQSLQSIQTLLRAGLGCITYLRNLLPSDNFSESYLTSSAPESFSSQHSKSQSSFSSTDGRRNVSGFKIMTVTRGFTEEADKLLDYLETGIFDALQKQYLRSFVFAIYLDDQDPNNVVEAYTFNFSYCKVPGSMDTVPVMSLGEDMMNLSLSGSRPSHDPVADATRKGKIPTLGEVKRSLKALVKNLIQATTQMDALPKRRFATFKLFYYEHTPDDYEPPHFRAGDAQKDKWFMTTHDRQEFPERCSVGSVQTGYHGVDVKVTSVSAYLPSAEDNSAPFLGTIARNPFNAPQLTPAEEAVVRAQQVEVQRQDASERRVVWDADDGLAGFDGRGDADGYRGDLDKGMGSALQGTALLGVRDEEGHLIPLRDLETFHDRAGAAEVQYAGRPESVPVSIGQLAKTGAHIGEDVSPTQEIEETQIIPSPLTSGVSSAKSVTPTPQLRRSTRQSHVSVVESESPLPPSDIPPSSSTSAVTPEPVDTQLVKDVIAAGTSGSQEDGMILDMETQQVPGPCEAEDPIQSFTETEGDIETPMDQDKESIAPTDCECGVQLEDCDCWMCDGGCGKWFHLWCMGYHSAQDHRIPPRFICFDCRVKADRNWDLIVVHDLYPRMIAKFKDLAIQRRGIKVFETHAPEGLSAFAKLIGCDSTVAGQVFRRLEAEGFIAQETREVDDTGFIETTSFASKRKTKNRANAKTKAVPRRKNLQKSTYVFVQAIKNEDAYKDYFNPDPEVEKRLLGLSDLKPERKSRKKKHSALRDAETEQFKALPRIPDGQDMPLAMPGAEETRPSNLGLQAQEETQCPGPDDRYGDLKRKTPHADEDQSGARKKIKISLGPAVDLGD